ncbi:MAG: DUF4170 domain-containing protein [Rhodospirillales bacterium]|nr:DUF4170 domain-containing protein [Rhodospirillales bacterium]
MAEFWVVGGEYADATFSGPLPGKAFERLGPFPSYEAARQVWQAHTMATIDNALVRYRIVRAADESDRTGKVA